MELEDKSAVYWFMRRDETHAERMAHVVWQVYVRARNVVTAESQEGEFKTVARCRRESI